MEYPKGLYLGRFLALPPYIRLGKRLTKTNTLAYSGVILILPIKYFIVQSPNSMNILGEDLLTIFNKLGRFISANACTKLV